MPASSIPDDVRRFLDERIESAEQLDILLLLAGAPDREWTARDVSQAVYTVPASATLRLESLVAAGLLASSGTGDPAYRYAPASDALRASVQRLAEVYRENRVVVITSLFQKPASPVQSFADAFRLRRD